MANKEKPAHKKSAFFKRLQATQGESKKSLCDIYMGIMKHSYWTAKIINPKIKLVLDQYCSKKN